MTECQCHPGPPLDGVCALCVVLKAELAALRAALTRENADVCEAVMEAVRWQQRYQDALVEVERVKAKAGLKDLR